MNRFLILCFTALFALPALAQDGGPYVYATYFECDAGALGGLDDIIGTAFPALDAHVAAGDLMAWAWTSHHTGGEWDRAFIAVAPTLEAVMSFNDAWIAENARDRPYLGRALGAACPSHVDYIWRLVASFRASGETAQDRPTTAISTYFTCAQDDLSRADDLVREAFGPVLNGLVEEGLLASWMWQAHVIGGPYTRMLSVDGASHMDLLRAHEELGARLEAQARTEFNAICSGHQDYLWNSHSSR